MAAPEVYSALERRLLDGVLRFDFRGDCDCLLNCTKSRLSLLTWRPVPTPAATIHEQAEC